MLIEDEPTIVLYGEPPVAPLVVAPLVPPADEREYGMVAGMLGQLAAEFPPLITPQHEEWDRWLDLIEAEWDRFKFGNWHARVGEWVPCMLVMNGGRNKIDGCLVMYQLSHEDIFRNGKLKRGCPRCREYGLARHTIARVARE